MASIPSTNSFTFAGDDRQCGHDQMTRARPWPTPRSTCGCAGGGKFWDTAGATVADNWVHGNGDAGIWVDTDNAGFNISDNYIATNWAEGIIYEISYNADITDNTLIDNAWGGGPSPALGGFPDPALYISESGSDSRVAGNYGPMFAVSGNGFTDNWGGVVIYENSNRACGISNDQYCTLVGPGTYTMSSCAAHIPNGSTTATPDYVDNCRWRSQNISVDDNDVRLHPGRHRRGLHHVDTSVATTGCSASPGPPRARLTTALGPRERAIPTGAMPSRTTSPTTSTTPTRTTPTAPEKVLPGTSSPSRRAME